MARAQRLHELLKPPNQNLLCGRPDNDYTPEQMPNNDDALDQMLILIYETLDKQLLNVGVDPKERPLPRQFLSNRDIWLDFIPILPHTNSLSFLLFSPQINST